MMRRSTLLALFTAPLLIATPVWAETLESGEITGEMKFRDQVIALTHVYAVQTWRIPPAMPEDRVTPYLRVTMADRAIPREYLNVEDLPWQVENPDPPQGIAIVVDLRSGKVEQLRPMEHEDRATGQNISGASADQASESIGMTEFRYDGRTLAAGILSRETAADEFGLSASLVAPVVQAPPILAILEGEEARNSEVGKAFVRYFEQRKTQIKRELYTTTLLVCGTSDSDCARSLPRNLYRTVPYIENEADAINGIVMFKSRAVIWYEAVPHNARTASTIQFLQTSNE